LFDRTNSISYYRVFTRSSKHRANIEQTLSWLKQAYWNPGLNVGLGLGS